MITEMHQCQTEEDNTLESERFHMLLPANKAHHMVRKPDKYIQYIFTLSIRVFMS